MEPKEKAIELINKYKAMQTVVFIVLKDPVVHKLSKDCAMIAVNEIIYSFDPINENLGSEFEHDGLTFKFLDYWKEVKEEIEKL